MFTDYPNSTLAALFFLVEGCGVLIAIHAIVHARSSQAAIAWSISLLAFPWISLPLYLFFGRNKYRGYVNARRRGDAAIQHLGVDLKRQFDAHNASHDSTSRRELLVYERLARMPFTQANQVELLSRGEDTFAALFAAIDSAQHYILVQSYIVRDDELGKALKVRLMHKATHNVAVYFLYDELGSFGLSNRYVDELQSAGVRITGFRNSLKKARRFQINFRNHRKIVVIDGHSAFLGGNNFGDEYVDRDPCLSPWRDTHVRIAGPAALLAQLAFIEDWYWVTGEELNLSWRMPDTQSDDKRVLVLPTGPADQLETCGLFFSQSIHSAQSRLWIVSPYFVPDRSTVSALQLAALRGVDVRILIPETLDHRFVYWASFSYLREVCQAGVKVYRFQNGFLHQKVMLIDDDFASVGTANLDNRSIRLNFEVSALVADQAFARQVAEMLKTDFEQSRLLTLSEVTDLPLHKFVAVHIARLFAPIL